MRACLHGVGGDQRLVVDGSRSLCCQLGGEVAVGSGKTLIVVVRYVVLTGKTALGSRGSNLGAQGCWDREGRNEKEQPRHAYGGGWDVLF